MGKSYLFLTPPATGELQPIYAIVERLLEDGDEALIHIASGSSFSSLFETFSSSLPENSRKRLFRVDLGSTDDVEDYSVNMLKAPSDPAKKNWFGKHRHSRGDPRPFFRYWEVFAAGTGKQRMATIRRVVELIYKIRPDFIVVDQIYGTPFDAIRSLRIPFVVIAPGHPSFLIDANPLLEPVTMSGTVWKGTIWNILANFAVISKLVSWMVESQWAKTTLKLRRWTLGFPWLSIGADSSITPPPGLVHEVSAVIACNIENLNYYPRQHPKIRYTGPLFRKSQGVPPRNDAGLENWMDEASVHDESIVFISFGSMFPFSYEDYNGMVEALRIAHKRFPRFRVLWKIVRADESYPAAHLPFVREVDWIPSVDRIYMHPATKVVIHHGGGNTANEVIWHGLKHLVIPQWADTYDWAATIHGFKLGLQTESSDPDLKAKDISQRLVSLLVSPEDFNHSVAYWQRRSKESGGTKQAVIVLHEQAKYASDSYQSLYSKAS